MGAPVLAALLIATVPQTDGAAEAAVLYHLSIPYRRSDTPELQPPSTPTRGVRYLIHLGEGCHGALLAALGGVDSGRHRLGADVGLGAVFDVLLHQKCDRSRFLPYAEKYATGERVKGKITEDTQRDALRLIGQIGGVKQIEKVAPLLADPEWIVRCAAINTITQLGDQRHAALIYDMQLSPKRFGGQLGNVEQNAIMAAYKTLQAKPPPASDKDHDKK